mgnify:CR=1 FL=1
MGGLIGAFAHPNPRRSLVVGDSVVTVSETGIKASSLATLAEFGLVQEVFRWGELNLALSALNVWHRQGTPADAVNYEKAVLLSLSGLTERAAKLDAAVQEGG